MIKLESHLTNSTKFDICVNKDYHKITIGQNSKL